MDNNNNYQPQYQPQPAPGPSQPQYQQPTYEQPSPYQPTYQPDPYQPAYQQPAYQQTIQPTYQQPVQPAYQQTYPPQYVNDPLMASADEMDLELKRKRSKKARTLCFISLGLYLSPFLVSIILYLISALISGASSASYSSMSSASTALGVAYIICLFIDSALRIGAWVTMIIARVKYKESVFAKVLMWVYIGLLIAAVVSTIILVAMCWAFIESLQGASC